MSLLLAILSWVFDKLFSKAAGPSQEAVQAGKAAAAETSLAVETNANVALLKASAARDAAVQSVASDDGLRAVEAADPNNRDNAA